MTLVYTTVARKAIEKAAVLFFVIASHIAAHLALNHLLLYFLINSNQRGHL